MMYKIHTCFRFLISITIIGLLCSVFSLDAVAQKAKKKKKKRNKTEQVEEKAPENDNPDIDRNYVEAAKNRITGNYKGAIENYLKVLELDADNHAAMYELGRLYYEDRDTQKALEMALGAATINPNNKWYNLLLAEMYNANNDFKNAVKVYEQLTKNDPINYEFWSDYAFMQLQAGDTKAALESLTKMEKQFGLDELIAKQKKALYIKEGKIDKAAAEIEKLIYINPTITNYYALLADVYLQDDDNEKAIEVYDRWLIADPENPYAYLSLADLYLKNGNKEKYETYINKAFNNNDLDIASKIKILLPYVEFIGTDKAKTEQAFNMVDILVEAHPKSSNVYAIKGDFHQRNKESDKALKAYKKSVELDSNAFSVWQQILSVEAELNRFDDLVKSCNKTIEIFPNQVMPYYFKGFALGRNKNYDDAITALKQGTLIGSENSSLMAQMYSQLADAYNAKKEYNKSDESFEEALKINPENATVLNNYSYYLSLRGERLEVAKEMAEKANKLETGNASFQDTYGWILYKLRQYDEAKKWVLKSYNNGGEKNATILDHLGDIEYRLDNKEKALDYWKRALEAGDVDDEELLKKKIADQKLYEQTVQ